MENGKWTNGKHPSTTVRDEGLTLKRSSLEKLMRRQNAGLVTRPSVRNQQYPRAAENMKSHAETAEITKTCACTKNE